MAIASALIGIGSAISGFVTGGAFTVAAGTLSSTIAGAIGGALVGAAIGGLTSAIMGGDIMSGVLFGAIGGAVTGGIAGWAQQGTMTVGTTASGQVASAPVGSAMIEPGTGYIAEAGRTTITNTLQTVGTDLIKEYGGDVIKGVASAYMEGKKMDAEQEMWLEKAAIEQQYKIDAMEKEADLAMKMSQSGGGGGSGSPPYMDMERIRQQTEREKLAEQRREFDTQHDERMLARSDLQEKESDRQALFLGYKGRGQDVGEEAGDTGVYETRQESALAATEGGQAITKPTGESTALNPVPEEETV